MSSVYAEEIADQYVSQLRECKIEVAALTDYQRVWYLAICARAAFVVGAELEPATISLAAIHAQAERVEREGNQKKLLWKKSGPRRSSPLG